MISRPHSKKPGQNFIPDATFEKVFQKEALLRGQKFLLNTTFILN